MSTNSIIPRSVGMYPDDWAIVDAAATNCDGNTSMALRRIIREWEKQRRQAQRSCPQCDRPTRPDPQRPGAFWCDHCQQPVLFDPTAALLN